MINLEAHRSHGMANARVVDHELDRILDEQTGETAVFRASRREVIFPGFFVPTLKVVMTPCCA